MSSKIMDVIKKKKDSNAPTILQLCILYMNQSIGPASLTAAVTSGGD